MASLSGCAVPLSTYENRGSDTTKSQAALIGKTVQPQPNQTTFGNVTLGQGASANFSMTPLPPFPSTFDGKTTSDTQETTKWSVKNSPAMWLSIVAFVLLLGALTAFFKLTAAGKATDAIVGRSLNWAKDKIGNETDPALIAVHKEYVAEMELLQTKLKNPKA